MKITLTFEHRDTGQHVKVTIDTARYLSSPLGGIRVRRSCARVAASDALHTALHLLGAQRIGRLHLANAVAS